MVAIFREGRKPLRFSIDAQYTAPISFQTAAFSCLWRRVGRLILVKQNRSGLILVNKLE